MDLYQEPYAILFNAITDVLEHIQQANYGLTAAALMTAQEEAEEVYIEGLPEVEFQEVLEGDWGEDAQ